MCTYTFLDKSNKIQNKWKQTLFVTEFLYSSSHLSRLWDKSAKLYRRQREREREREWVHPQPTLLPVRWLHSYFPQSKPPILIAAVQLILPLCPSAVSERWGRETLEGEHIATCLWHIKPEVLQAIQLLPHMYLLIWRLLPAQLLEKGGRGSQERQPKLTLDIQYSQGLNWPEPSLESNFSIPKLPQECRAWNEVRGSVFTSVCAYIHDTTCAACSWPDGSFFTLMSGYQILVHDMSWTETGAPNPSDKHTPRTHTHTHTHTPHTHTTQQHMVPPSLLFYSFWVTTSVWWPENARSNLWALYFMCSLFSKQHTHAHTRTDTDRRA